jgi:hypothetical protein
MGKECSAGVNLLVVINIILFISACICVICYAGAPVSFKASFAWPQVRLKGPLCFTTCAPADPADGWRKPRPDAQICRRASS